MQNKICTECNKRKSIKRFHIQKSGKHGVRAICIKCRRKKGRKYSKAHKKEKRENYFKNKQHYTNIHIRKKYGITLKQYNKMLKSQNNCCAICGKPEEEKEKNKSIRKLAIDHDHKTGNVRGLLCGKCNKGIGLLQGNIKILINATKYLIQHNGNK